MVKEGLEEVVISGVSGVFPYCNNIDELSENLFSKANLIRSDDCRWSPSEHPNAPAATGKILSPATFDTAHFGIHRKQTESMDPLCCQVAERAFEAVMDAGVNPTELRGTNTAVYISTSMSDTDNVFDYEATGDGFGVMGHNRSMIASRLAYYFDTKGPTYVIIAAWAGGLQALELAYKAISERRCKAAIIGSANLVLFPQMSNHMRKMRLISPDGITRSFDESGEGCGRSDAAVAMLVQRKRDAKRIYCSVLGANVICFGDRKEFLPATQINFSRLLKGFYEEFKIDASEVSYVEADGSATLENDREELNAMDEVFLKNRKKPLLVGCVKSNIGHTEGASSLCSLVKLIIAMQRKCIPPNMHYNKPISGVPALENGKLQVVTESTPFEEGLMAVTSVGVDGCYGHAVIKPFDKKKPKNEDSLPHLVTMSSRTQEGLTKILSKLESMPVDPEYLSLIHHIFSTNIPNYLCRGYTILSSDTTRREVEFCPPTNRPVWFIFSGMGSQWPTMGASLMQLPIFAETIRKCHDTLKPLGVDLMNIITTEDEKIFDNILNSFVGIAAVQIGLVDILYKLGIRPDGIIGHSVGELGCAYADGSLTAEQMILCSYYRGKASLEAELIKGMMAAVGMGYQDIKNIIPPDIEVACHNSRNSCTLSGPTKSVEDFVEVLKAKKVFARAVNVSNIAYHSTYIKPAAPLLLDYLKKVIPNPKPRSDKWICTSIQEKDWKTDLAKTVSAEYLTNNLLSYVYFEEGSAHVPKNAICIEIAPHGLLQAILRKSLNADCSNIPLTKRGEEKGLEFLLSALGKLYICGLNPKVSEIYPPVEFPVSHGTPFLSSLCEWDHSEEWPIISSQEDITVGEKEIELNMNQEETRSYAGHVIGGHIVIPPAAFLKMALEHLLSVLRKPNDHPEVVFQNVVFHRLVIIPRTGSVKVYLITKPGSGDFEFILNDEIIVRGQIILPDDINKEFANYTPEPIKNGVQLTEEDIYTEFKHRNYQYSGKFRAVMSTTLTDRGCTANVKPSREWVPLVGNILQLVQLVNGESGQELQYLSSFQRLVLNSEKLPQNSEETEAVFYKHPNILKCAGIEICGAEVTTVPTNFAKNPRLKVESVNFFSHNSSSFKNLNEFLETSLQLTIENKAAELESKSKGYIRILCNEQNLSEIVQSSLLSFPLFDIMIQQGGSLQHEQVKEKISADCILVIADEIAAMKAEKVLQENDGFLLLISEKNDWNQNLKFVPIIKYTDSTRNYVLLKKETKVNVNLSTVINITPKAEVWLQNLQSNVEKLNDPLQRIYLVSKTLPICGVDAFISLINRNLNTKNLRYFFILDEKAPEFSLTHNFYKQQILMDLVINVYSESSWGTIRNMFPTSTNTYTEEASLQIGATDVKLSYIGLNKYDPVITEDVSKMKSLTKLGPVDFVGINSKGQRIMGVLQRDSMKTCEYLSWPVPDTWSLEDAATVPFAYAMAYYAVKILENKQSLTRNILIHSGCTPFGIATINVAIQNHYTIWTTVGSDEERSFLKKMFPQLEDIQVGNYNENKIYADIMTKTNGVGIALMINTLTGDKMNSTFRCAAAFSSFVQLAQLENDKHHLLGLGNFLKGVSFYSVSSNKIFYLNENEKRKIHELVSEGIKNGTVKPLNRKIFDHNQSMKAANALFQNVQLDKILVKTHLSQKKAPVSLNEYMNYKLNFYPENSYLILGGSMEEWLSLTEWLIKQGAKKITVATHIEKTSNYLSRRLNLFKKYHNADIVLDSSSKILTPIGATNLVKQINNRGSLSAIFILPMVQSESSRFSETENITAAVVRDFDIASRTSADVQFICMFCDGADSICLSRRKSGLKGVSIKWSQQNKSHMDLKSVLHQLEDILISTADTVLSMINIEPDSKTNADAALSSRLDYLLPYTRKEIAEIGLNLRNKDYYYEMSTLSPDWEEIKDSIPAFLVSGIHSKYSYHRGMANTLMFPLFNFHATPVKSTIEESAAAILQEIKKIQQKGTYVLIGDSYGGVLALEIAAQLEKNGDKVNVYLLDGAPNALKMSIKLLGDGAQLESNIITKLLQLQSEKVNQELSKLPNWESRLQYALAATEFTSEIERDLVAEGMSAILHYISLLLKYQPTYKLNGNVSLILPGGVEEENYGLVEFCKQTINIHTAGKDYETMIKSRDVTRLINFSKIY